MSYSVEKEFIRECFMDGTLDLSRRETLKRFCQIFSGEVESYIALSQCAWLDMDDKDDNDFAQSLIKIANPSKETISEYNRWLKKVHG